MGMSQIKDTPSELVLDTEAEEDDICWRALKACNSLQMWAKIISSTLFEEASW